MINGLRKDNNTTKKSIKFTKQKNRGCNILSFHKYGYAMNNPFYRKGL